MDELALKLSDILDISMEAAVDLYPILREQYIWYSLSESLSVFQFLAFSIGFILLAILFWLSLDGLKTHPSDLGHEEGDPRYDRMLRSYTEERERLSRLLKGAVACLVLSFVTYIILTIVKHVFAPDILLILEFFN